MTTARLDHAELELIEEAMIKLGADTNRIHPLDRDKDKSASISTVITKLTTVRKCSSNGAVRITPM